MERNNGFSSTMICKIYGNMCDRKLCDNIMFGGKKWSLMFDKYVYSHRWNTLRKLLIKIDQILVHECICG